MNRLLLLVALLLLAAGAGAEERKSTAGSGVQVLSPPMTIPGLGRTRTIRIYLPPSYAAGKRRYPVLYMHDGQNLFDDATSFVGEWGVDEAMDTLAKQHGLEVIVVGIDQDNEHRTQELTAWDNPKYGAAEGREYMRFVVEVLKPWIDAHYRTRPGREDTGIMGSSLGGLISHYAAFEYPRIFGRIGIFSPAYWFAPPVYELSRQQLLPPHTRMVIVAGDSEGDEPLKVVADTNRMVAELRLEQPGLRLRADIRAGGEHNERAWRAAFPDAVLFLFGRD
ncbi:MAG: alpha/beta hydrolase-fold protein [Arenimonas sp.]